MHEPTRTPRTLEQIDHDLDVERGILRFDQANGRRPPPDRSATWRFIDALLDERLVVRPLPPRAPRPVDGRLVR